jgi:hypothetical protein
MTPAGRACPSRLLHIDASPRNAGSHLRRLTHEHSLLRFDADSREWDQDGD